MENKKHQSLRVLLVFIHGFRGSDQTFEGFPEQLKSSLHGLIPEAHINIAVYPQFETKGNISKAIDGFCDWLKGIEGHRRSQSGGDIPLLTIMVGHSMGGLLGSDAYLRYLSEKQDTNSNKDSLYQPFPELLGIIAYETPFYGLNKNMFSRHATSKASTISSVATSIMSKFTKKAIDTREVKNTREVKDTGNSKMKYALGGLAIAAVAAGAAGAYLYKDHIGSFYQYVTDHLEFINELGKPKELATRVKKMSENEETLFHCFYVETPTEDGVSTFVNVPGINGTPQIGRECFTSMNYPTKDEIQSHVRMFNPKINTSYYEMAKQSVALIHYAIRSYQAKTDNNVKVFTKPIISPMNPAFDSDLELD